MNCPVTNCLITRDMQRFRHPSEVDVVLFIGEHDVINYVKEIEGDLPGHHMYALLISEPPHICPDFSYLDNKINMTISYRHDADAKFSYGFVGDKVLHTELPYDPVWRDPDAGSSYLANSTLMQIVKGKTKMVAWFVSNCKLVASKRMELTQVLKKYVEVDVYGRCGHLQCAKGDSKCNDMLETDYKFYLSFENSLCKDYMTEKVFNAMQKTIVPVIYNGAEVTKFLPPKSYINVEDFATVKDLADYLKFLSDNPQEYIKYFWWKEHYYISQWHYSCSFCQALNKWNRGPKPALRSVQQWHKNGTCRAPKIKF